MTTATLPDRRSIKAQMIVQAGDIHESKPGLWRVRDTNGSGTWHYTTATSCDCIDHGRTGLACKHMLSVKQAANGSTKPAGPVCPDCGAATYADLFYVSGTYRSYRICTADKYHKAQRLS